MVVYRDVILRVSVCEASDRSSLKERLETVLSHHLKGGKGESLSLAEVDAVTEVVADYLNFTAVCSEI